MLELQWQAVFKWCITIKITVFKSGIAGVITCSAVIDQFIDAVGRPSSKAALL